MATVDIIRFDAHEQHGTALIAPDDTVWISYCPHWWDLASRIWWWFCPSDKKASVVLNLDGGRRVRTLAIRVARRHVRIGSPPTQVMEET